MWRKDNDFSDFFVLQTDVYAIKMIIFLECAFGKSFILWPLSGRQSIDLQENRDSAYFVEGSIPDMRSCISNAEKYFFACHLYRFQIVHWVRCLHLFWSSVLSGIFEAPKKPFWGKHECSAKGCISKNVVPIDHFVRLRQSIQFGTFGLILVL
jgi:hypothetical protein